MLRTRLMLGLLCLLVILLSMGLYSIDRCSKLGWRIKDLSSESIQVHRDIQRMKRSCAAMTGALLFRVTGDKQWSQLDFENARKEFDEALREELRRPVLNADERKALQRLSSSFESYSRQAREFLSETAESTPAWRSAAARLGADIADLLHQVEEMQMVGIQRINDRGKVSANDINQAIRSLIFLMIIAVMVFIYAFARLSRGLLHPLVSLTSSIREVGEGNLDQTIPVLSNDELGVLATTFNKMAEQLKKYRANTSEELMRLNTTVRAMLASFPDPIFVLNSKGAVELRNPAADQLAVKLLFAGVTRLPQKVDEKVEEVRASETDYLPTSYKEAIKFHIDGRDRYFLPRIVLLRDDRQETFGVAVILEEVTKMLLLDDVKSNLIATVSHELKTPLTSVRLALYLLHEKNVGPLSSGQEELVETAREDADRLLKTLNDLLDLAKLEQGKSPLQIEDVSAPDLVHGAAKEARDLATAAGINLIVDVPPDLPRVQVDRQRVAYVFSNLLTNSIKYSPAKTEIILKAETIVMHSNKPGVRFSIRDQGAGISPEHQEHIFERFYRVPGTTKSGAGLGLSIAREIVEAHQGEIGVLSAPGSGSEFFFVIPSL